MSNDLLPREGGEDLTEIACANQGCEELFIPKTHNQIYHNDECCRQATNRRMMEKYYANRDRKLGKKRLCKACGVTRLSRYNESDICSSCTILSEKEKNNAVISMFLNASIII